MDTNTPSMPVSSTSRLMKKASPRSLMEFHEPRMATTDSSVVSRTSRSEMPSMPRW